MEVQHKLGYPDKEASTCDVDKKIWVFMLFVRPIPALWVLEFWENILRGRDREGNDNDGSISEGKIRQ